MKQYFTFTDLLIATVIVIICAIGLKTTASTDSAEKIIIETDGKIYASYNLKSLGKEARDIEINTKYGKNILRIDCEGADMIYSDCLNQIDVRHKKITKSGEIIVCAPHRLTVYISGSGEADAVSR